MTVTFENGVVSSFSESGLERVSEPSSAVRLAGDILYPIRYIEDSMAAILCIYVATLLTGYTLTIKRIVVLGLIMAGVGLVLSLLLGPLGLVGIPIYLIVYLVVLVSIIMAWTGATGGDAVLIVIGSWVSRSSSSAFPGCEPGVAVPAQGRADLAADPTSERPRLLPACWDRR